MIRPITHAQATVLADRIRATANPVRVQLISLLAYRPARQIDLMACLKLGGTSVSQSNLSAHLMKLRKADLVTSDREGPVVTFRLTPDALALPAGYLRAVSAR